MTLIRGDGDSQGIKLLCVVVVFLAFAIAMTGLRVWSRMIKRQSLELNDYACFAALLFTAGLAAAQITAIAIGGIGQHVENLTPEMTVVSLKAYTVAWLLWAAGNTFARLSVLHLLHQIFPDEAFRKVVWVLATLTTLFFVGIFIVFWANCIPFSQNWELVTNGQCGHPFLPYVLSDVFNLLLHAAIIAIPMPVLWKLQLPTPKKVALSVVFGIGGIICIMTIMRIIAVVNFNHQKRDWSYYLVQDGMWSSIEPSLGVVNACLLFMPVVFQKISGSPMFSWTRKGMNGDRNIDSYAKSDTVVNPVRWAGKEGRQWENLGGEDDYRLTTVSGNKPRTKSVDISHIQVVQSWEVRSGR